MQVLVVDAFVEPTRAAKVIAVLRARGNEVDHLVLADRELSGYMSEAEHRAYETDEPLINDAVRRSAEMVKAADALVFVYPTTLFGVPPVLKGWLERVMVLGVAFVFDAKRRIRPGLTNVRRLAAVTTTRHSRRVTWRARDLGYRTIMRTLRMNCHARCRQTFVRLPESLSEEDHDHVLARRFRRW